MAFVPTPLLCRVLEFVHAFMMQIAIGEEDLCVAAGELSAHVNDIFMCFIYSLCLLCAYVQEKHTLRAFGSTTIGWSEGYFKWVT